MTKKIVAADIGSINPEAASDAGAEFELVHPETKEPLGVFITALGQESSVFKDHLRETTNARIRKQHQLRRRGKDLDPLTVEQQEAEGIDALVLLTRGWRTGDEKVITFEGAKLDFNVPNCRRLYTERPWIRKQVDEATADLSLFMTS